MHSTPHPGPADAEAVATIVVVEDEVLMRPVICDYLRDCGYQVVEAASAAEAKAVLQSDTKVDLVFSDVQMPGKADRFALASWVREHDPDLPVTLTFGWAGVAEKARELSHEGTVVPKP